MLAISLREAQLELRARVNSVCRVPELPPELAEDLREVMWALVMHYEHLGYQWSLLNEMQEELTQL
jgi:hypothetical protein